ncbi:MAG TPA: tetratricopeptide repeat protein, partial [Candidatus Deferrimicrobiaceae bacterium]
MPRFSASRILPFLLAALLLPGGAPQRPAHAQEPPTPGERAESIAEEARQHRELMDYPRALEKYREALALHPGGGTWREVGDLFAETDRHREAIDAYRAAVAADASLEPELRMSIGVQLLWADRAEEALPLLASVVENRPHDPEARRYLALALRWSDRLREAEELYRQILGKDPRDTKARLGLSESLLWQGRFQAAAQEYLLVLEEQPAEPEALAGLSRARLFQEMPEEAEEWISRAEKTAPGIPEVREQSSRVRERLARYAELGIRGSRDSDELSVWELSLSVHGRPARGLDLDATARQLFFRQGSPGKQDNLGAEDSADGTGGAFSAAWRRSPAFGWRAGAGYTRYDVAGFRPWSANLGVSATPVDTVRIDLDWERGHWDSILSFQNRVVLDTAGLTVSKHFAWKTEISASAALLIHRNANATNQERNNRGARFGLTLTRRLYLRGDIAYLAGILRFGWLGFDHDLDVGVFDPERYTSQEAGIDWRVRLRPGWEFRGTALAGAQQEKGAESGPTYTVEAALDRKIGLGVISLGG